MTGKRVLLLVATLVLPSLLAGNAFSGGVETLEQALKISAEENKPVLIDFYATWCGPCKAFDKASKEDADIQAALGNFVVVKYDAEKGRGKELAEMHSVRGYPTYVVANAEGNVLDRWASYDKDMFLKRAEDVRLDPTTVKEKQARFEAGPTEKDAAKLGQIHDSKGEYGEAVEFYKHAQRLNPEAGGAYAMRIFEATYHGVRGEVYSLDDLTASAEAVFSNQESDGGELILVARLIGSAAKKSDRPEMAHPYLKTAVERTENSENTDVLNARKRVMPEYALQILQDEEKAVSYKKASLGEGWMDNPDALNSYAWWCFENTINLEEAQELAQRGAELAEPGSDRAMILDTVAEICNARGDCGEAVAWMKKALENDPESERYQKQLTRFEELLAAQKN